MEGIRIDPQENIGINTKNSILNILESNDEAIEMSNFDENRFKTVKQDWETPDDLFNYLNDIYGFTIDLAADSQSTKCEHYFTKEDDALSKTWFGVGWLNPPYGTRKPQLKDWVKKAFDETRKEGCAVVMLMPARTNTAWWHDYCMKAREIRFIKGRPKFKGCIHGLPQPLAIIIFGIHNNETKYSSLKID